ncbi:hypothetical protein PCASD_00968 [Puccinia coronata f. sp. avenae]|uniref:RRP12 HEAT domain-containing protein n=1 Tax=Puccinia coronata f. sp. avenae TaxID=200324 RepID=A0A2N5VMQ6_9BASI|nr:hypothetical protein PCASD_00968 [Puccinia coronata f. sp. avenae]
MEQTLSKLRGHFNGTQQSVANLLEAVESSIPQKEPAHYYHAILATLQTIQSSQQNNSPSQEHVLVDALYLLAIILPHLATPILKIETRPILELIQPISNQFNQNQPALKSILNILHPIYATFNATQLADQHLQTVAQPLCLRFILPLTLSQQAKTRRAATQLITHIITHPPTPLRTHPYQPHIIKFIFQQLNSLISNHSKQPELSNTLIISLLKFIQSIITTFQQDQIQHQLIPTCLNSLNTIHHNQPYLTSTIYNTIETIFSSTTKLEADQILDTINQIIQLQQHPAQLTALEHAWICLARLNPELCAKELPKIGQLASLFQNFGNADQDIRTATKSLLTGICRYCLTDDEIISAIQKNSTKKPQSSIQLILHSILLALASTDVIALGGTLELLAVLKSLVLRLPPNHRSNQQQQQPASCLLKEHVLALDKLRATRVGLGPIIDEVFTCISQICGPAFLLEILPLNLNLEEDNGHQQHESGPGRAWLLTLLKVFNSSLAHFVSYFVPLSEKLLEKKRDTLKIAHASADQKLKQNGQLQVKIYDTLIEQIWRLLPGYCDLPYDLTLAFDRPFAELLTQVIYSQPTLRPPIFNALKILIDKTVLLTKRSLPVTEAETKSKNKDGGVTNEFGFNPHAHLEHLKGFAPNFLAVLFNVYNSSYDPAASSETPPNANSNRGYMVDCMRSMLEIISDKELNESYQKIKSLLDQSIKSKSQSTVNTQKMLDLLTVLLPRLVSSSATGGDPSNKNRLKEIQALICQDVLILSADSNLQKKSFKLLTTFLDLVCQRGLVKEAIDDLDGLINKLLALDGKGKVSGPAKRDRALLVSGLVSIIPVDKLHHIPRLLTEVVLGCKESNADVRGLSYEVLIKIGNKMKEHGGKVDWKALLGGMEEEGEETMDDGEQDASIEEYFKMISAGLAGTSPHMVSATIAALSRVFFEFHDELSRTTIDELISTIEIFLNSPNREIAKTAIGFMKVAVISLPREVVLEQLDKMVPGLLKWANEHKNYFKSNIQSLLERLLRKFGFETLEKFVTTRDENDGGRKLVYSLKKKQKKKKLQQQPRGENDENEGESDGDQPTRQPRLGDAYEEALYGGESSDDDDDDDRAEEGNQKAGKGANTKQKKKRAEAPLDNHLLEDDEDQIMDLLDGGRMANRAMAGKLAKAEKRKQELKKIGAGYKKDSASGKMIIDESETEVHGKKGKEGASASTNAFLEAIHGADGFRRDARGAMKPNKKRKQDPSLDHDDEEEDEDDDEQKIQEAVQGFHIGERDSAANKKKKVKRVKERLGAEFKAKKAGGDRVSRSKDGQAVSPFAYLPLNAINSKKKKNNVAKSLNITGKVRGSASRA